MIFSIICSALSVQQLDPLIKIGNKFIYIKQLWISFQAFFYRKAVLSLGMSGHSTFFPRESETLLKGSIFPKTDITLPPIVCFSSPNIHCTIFYFTKDKIVPVCRAIKISQANPHPTKLFLLSSSKKSFWKKKLRDMVRITCVTLINAANPVLQTLPDAGGKRD